MKSTTLPHTLIPSPNHYNSRNGCRVEWITLHIMVGSLAGTDSVFQRASYQASTHYGIGSNGEIHQYVSEDVGAWGDGSKDWNSRSISIEHEGGSVFYPCTIQCVQASAKLCADIARRYGWTRLVLGQNIKRHRDNPATDHKTCPDLAPNGLPVENVINAANNILAAEQTMTEMEDNPMADIMIRDDNTGSIYYCNPLIGRVHLTHPDQCKVLEQAGVATIHGNKDYPIWARFDQIHELALNQFTGELAKLTPSLKVAAVSATTQAGELPTDADNAATIQA